MSTPPPGHPREHVKTPVEAGKAHRGLFRPWAQTHEDTEGISGLEMEIALAVKAPGSRKGVGEGPSCCFTWNTKKGAVALSLNNSEKSGTTISALRETRPHILFTIRASEVPS